jgi:hypothetical protein
MNRFFLTLVWCLAIVLLRSVGAAPQKKGDPHRAGLTPAALGLFAPSTECMACHNGLSTGEHEDVSIGTMWRSTMMANSARDPYFQAGLRRETIDHPSIADDIQNECAGCHAPMLQRAAHASGAGTRLLERLSAGADADASGHQLGVDGVSCTVCHQIADEGLGSRDTFNGRFQLAPAKAGVRQAFGPFDVDNGRTRIMHSVTGYKQNQATHIRESSLCATCHTLYTQAHDAGGKVVGELPEQMNFQEWQHSAFYGEQRSCQSCHMPQVSQPTRIASVLGEQREGLARHLFVGGNFFVLRMLDRFRNDLAVEALSPEFAATAGATLRQLSSETATMTVRTSRADAGVQADVTITTLTGHKFPTGYPSRRAWLHLTARDTAGRVVFESGALRADGSIDGNDNDTDPARFEEHHNEIATSDQVQIYETLLADPGGALTTGLLRATRYLKDNRLLPRGFDKRTADRDIAVHGAAVDDLNFAGGEDVVRYRLPATAASVDVELRYQPIAYRWAQNLRTYDAPEPRRFVAYYDAMASESSAVIAHAATVVAAGR